MWGYNSASATPIWALWAAAWRSARRTSGRRRSKFGRNARGHLGGSGQDVARTHPGPQLLRRNAQQDAQLIGRLPKIDLELGDLGLGLLQVAPGLDDVELAGRARLESGFGDPQRLTLDLHVELGVSDPLLDDAHLRVVRRHVPQQGDQHVVVIFDRGVQAVVGRFDGAAEPAPEVELPREREPVRPRRVVRRTDVRAVRDLRAFRVPLVVRRWPVAIAGRTCRPRSPAGHALPGPGTPPGGASGSGGRRRRSRRRAPGR